MLNQEGGVDDEEYRWYNLIDRVDTTASVWLGSTMACAQCHNHKYDPFTQKDFYQFLAFFDHSKYEISNLGQGEGWVVEPELELPTPEQETKSKAIKAEIANLETVLETPTPELEAAQESWEEEMKRADQNWTVLHPSTAVSQGGATLRELPDGSLLASGKNPEADVYTLTGKVEKSELTAIRVEVLNDDSLPQKGPGRDAEGNFFLSHVEAQFAPTEQPQAVQTLSIKTSIADESQEGYQASQLTSGKPSKTGWAISAT